jgi:hypothetical protein
VQAAAHGRLAQLHVVGLGAGQVLEHVAELVGRHHAHVDAHAGVRRDARAGVAGGVDGVDQLEPGERADQRRGVARGGDDVDVLGRVGQAAQRAGDLHAVGRRVVAQRTRDLLGDRQRAREQDARRRALGSATSAQVLDLGPEPRSPDPPCSAAERRLQRVHAELVKACAPLGGRRRR